MGYKWAGFFSQYFAMKIHSHPPNFPSRYMYINIGTAPEPLPTTNWHSQYPYTHHVVSPPFTQVPPTPSHESTPWWPPAAAAPSGARCQCPAARSTLRGRRHRSAPRGRVCRPPGAGPPKLAPRGRPGGAPPWPSGGRRPRRRPRRRRGRRCLGWEGGNEGGGNRTPRVIAYSCLPKGSTQGAKHAPKLGIWKIVSRLESRSAAAPDAVATPTVLGSECPGWQGKVASS